MYDSKHHSGGQDRTRINVNEDYELRDWSKKFGVTPQQLREAVKAVGTQVAQVQQYLQSGSPSKQHGADDPHEHPQAARQQQAGETQAARGQRDMRDSGAHGDPSTTPVADKDKPVHEAPHQSYSAPR